MNIRELNCGTMCPLGGHFVSDKAGRRGWRGHMVARVWLVETAAGLVLIDAGFGSADPRRLPRAFCAITGPVLDPAETALHQLAKLGYRASDVRHIVLTHMDLDHAGGISDFPDASVHVHAREHEAAMRRASLKAKNRYLPSQWAHGAKFVLHSEEGETWNGFGSVRALAGTCDDLLLIPTPGHSLGHCVVAVRGDDRWWVHAGDALFHQGALLSPPVQPFGLSVFERVVAADDRARAANVQRLRALAAQPGVKVVSAHDPAPSQLPMVSV